MTERYDEKGWVIMDLVPVGWRWPPILPVILVLAGGVAAGTGVAIGVGPWVGLGLVAAGAILAGVDRHRRVESERKTAAATQQAALDAALDALKQSEARFRDYTDTANDWFWETGPDLKFTTVSDRAAALGITVDRLGALDRLIAKAGGRAAADCWLLIEDLRPFQGVRCRVAGADQAVDLTMDGTPILDEQGDFKGYRGSARDVTDQKSAAEAIRRANLDLERRVAERTADLTASLRSLREAQGQVLRSEKMASLGILAGGIAHEINTPIQFIGDNLGYLKGAMDDLDPLFRAGAALAAGDGVSADLAAAIRRIDLAATRLDMMGAVDESIGGVGRITEIVKAVKLFSHTGETPKTPQDAAKLVQTVVAVTRNTWKYVADLITEIEPNLPLVPCQATEIDQVLLALIVNASHAIEDRHDTAMGRITLTVRRVPGGVEFSVADTGIGIPETHRAKVWDLFFTTKPPGRGTGQGLTICHNIIVDKHGGTINFESTVGQGTRFFFTLPLGDEGAEPDGAADLG